MFKSLLLSFIISYCPTVFALEWDSYIVLREAYSIKTQSHDNFKKIKNEFFDDIDLNVNVMREAKTFFEQSTEYFDFLKYNYDSAEDSELAFHYLRLYYYEIDDAVFESNYSEEVKEKFRQIGSSIEFLSEFYSGSIWE